MQAVSWHDRRLICRQVALTLFGSVGAYSFSNRNLGEAKNELDSTWARRAEE